jgi:EAL domain-containing protein (putative c-di-GMP-specific phosphodiesterase class I)
MEALLRWKSQELGTVTPSEFIPVAEESSLILPIGEWVIREACIQAKKWRDAGLPLPVVAVNISVMQFIQAGFVKMVERILRETGLDPEALELEVTESLLFKDSVLAVETLRNLKKIGVKLAIDDFGTGYSNMSRLKDFPIDRLKIDRSFVHEVASVERNRAIVSAVIAMAESMCMRVVAEGVETSTQFDFLKGKHCHDGQGFLISRPMPAAEAESFLETACVAECVQD